MDRAELPGADLIDAGLRDLDAGVESLESLLVSIARERLVAAGVDVPAPRTARPSHRLYDLIATDHPADAHSRFNALLNRLSSFARAAEHAAAR